MLQWLQRTCFTNLEKESQKNRLLLFLMLPLLLLAEIDILVNVPFLHPTNLMFLSAYFALYGVCFLLQLHPVFEKAFKYAAVGGMVVFSMFQIWLFNDYPIIYQIVYINLALAMIYLNGYLIMFIGLATAAFTAIGFLFWKDVFFPYIDISLANIPIILVLQATVVLWGAAKIGVTFRDYISNNVKMKLLLEQNEQQLLLIQERNYALEQYAKQVEKLAVLEERTRIAREMHDTMGHTLTSIIAGLEVLKHGAGLPLPAEQKRMESLLHTARKGLEEVRNHVHSADVQAEDELLDTTLRQLTEELSTNANVRVGLLTTGEPYELYPQQRFALLRCAQEALTNAVRHGGADAVRVELAYQADHVRLRIEDNGKGADDLTYGFGLQAMKSRAEALQGTLQVSSGISRGVTVECVIPAAAVPKSEPIRVLLAEDQMLIAESFSILLGMEDGIKVLGIAPDGEKAVNYCEQHTPDVILMDIGMPNMNGIEATRMIKQRWPSVKVILLTTFQDVDHASQAIMYGAEAYLLKSVHPKHLSETIRIVHAGGTLIPLETARMLLEGRQAAAAQAGEAHAENNVPPPASQPLVLSGAEKLSEREMEILHYLSEGFKYREIAEKMHYSEGTVKNYVSAIYSKLNVENRLQAIRKVQQLKGD
ncbi:helix-turn-helix transcriptional regulator [Paenibacillus thermotolerans]|uniref:helix-turn-helix transcriptional regulator n=1 Tax=Paenibacillus thermotolerans TaxID=3027807 RepID=UPI0023684D95|nr:MULTISPECIES: hybrid sensor histidine kinase/response regulator transcription factor [unclassified Paenibacillus]